MATQTQLYRRARKTGTALLKAHLRAVTAESCTGGWVAKALTDVPGSSQWFEEGYVTYSNEAKRRTLGVKARTLKDFGAVSEEVVREMARGALKASRSDVAVAISGIAGPDGGTAEKPVGLVWFCWGRRRGRSFIYRVQRGHFTGNRDAIRAKAAFQALKGLQP